jgi:hypothetical protein
MTELTHEQRVEIHAARKRYERAAVEAKRRLHVLEGLIKEPKKFWDNEYGRNISEAQYVDLKGMIQKQIDDIKEAEGN